MERELNWLSRQQARGAIVASACTGAIILAESEVLDGWEATRRLKAGPATANIPERQD